MLSRGAKPPVPESRPLEGVRALLLERDHDLAEVTTLLLEWLGAEVVRPAAELPPDLDLVIFDDASRSGHLFRAARHAGIPVILLSADDESRWSPSPPLVVLPKPVTPSALVQAIQRVCRVPVAC